VCGCKRYKNPIHYRQLEMSRRSYKTASVYAGMKRNDRRCYNDGRLTLPSCTMCWVFRTLKTKRRDDPAQYRVIGFGRTLGHVLVEHRQDAIGEYLWVVTALACHYPGRAKPMNAKPR